MFLFGTLGWYLGEIAGRNRRRTRRRSQWWWLCTLFGFTATRPIFGAAKKFLSIWDVIGREGMFLMRWRRIGFEMRPQHPLALTCWASSPSSGSCYFTTPQQGLFTPYFWNSKEKSTRAYDSWTERLFLSIQTPSPAITPSGS